MAQITCAHWPLRMIKDTTILSSVTLQCWPIFRLHHMHADYRYGVLLQMSHVAWSVCLSVCVGHMDELCRNDWIDWDAVWGLTHVGPEKLYWSGGPDPCAGRGTLEQDMCRPMVTHIYVSNVPGQCMQQAHAFAAARGDKTILLLLFVPQWWIVLSSLCAVSLPQ